MIVGPHNPSAIGTLMERHTGYVKLVHPNISRSPELQNAPVWVLNGIPHRLRETPTWDQGREMAKQLEITHETGTRIYFCDRASPWQRSSNENNNGLPRQYFPKSTDLRKYTPADLIRAWQELNERPRASLDDHTPGKILTRLLQSHDNS